MRMARTLLAAAAALSIAPVADAYMYWLHYQNRVAPFAPAAERFDLDSIPGRRIPFFVSQSGPTAYAQGDSFPALLSEIRAAAQAWNSASTSSARLQFGGLFDPNATMSGPHVEVLFSDEIADGIEAMAGPVSRLDPVTTSSGTFVPIQRSVLLLRKDLSQSTAYQVGGEGFFLTLVHEFGHTLGLQHSWSGGVMSTAITRTTTKSHPLDADDMAGISGLYPATGYPGNLGSISGHVTLADRSAVHLASVVALTSTGPAVSALTLPDGSYRIDGLAPGNYFVYVHPLPPGLAGEMQPVNLDLPVGPDGVAVSPGPAFDTVFYPGTAAAQVFVTVGAGVETANVDFAVTRRDKVNVHSVQTYSFSPGSSVAVKPATLPLTASTGSVILAGFGLSSGTAPLPGLSISLLNAPETVLPNGVSAYPYSVSYIQVDLGFSSQASTPGVRHMRFSINGENYIAPSSVHLVASVPPSITAVSGNADGTLTLNGSGFQTGMTVWLDGAAAEILSLAADKVTIAPPAAPSGYRAVVAAFNPDGQSSLMWIAPNAPFSPSWTYGTSDLPQVGVSPALLPAGVETAVEITTSGLPLTAASAQVGFGSSDISVLKIYPVSANRARAQAVVGAGATEGPTPVTAISGLQIANTAVPFQVMAATPKIYIPVSKMSGSNPYPGGVFTLPVANLPQTASIFTTSVTFDDLPATVVDVSPSAGTVQLLVPASLTPGFAVVSGTVNGTALLPSVLPVDAVPPMLLKVQWAIVGQDISQGNAPKPGELVQVLARGLGQFNPSTDAARLKLLSGTVEHSIIMVSEASGQTGLYQILFYVSPAVTPSSAVPLTLTLDGRASNTITFPVRP
jgi:hypothetical protein